MSVNTADNVTVDQIDLASPAFWSKPRAEQHPLFAMLRAEAPISRHRAPAAWEPSEFPSQPFWAVTRHADVQAVTRDTANFSNTGGTGFAMDGLPARSVRMQESFLSMDRPEHTKLRRLVNGTFTPRTMENMRGWVVDQSRRAIASVAELGSCDFHNDITAKFAFGVICDLVGAPEADRTWLAETGKFMGSASYGDDYEPATYIRDLLQAVEEIATFGADLARSKRASGDLGNDILSNLIRAEVDGEALSDDEVGNLFYLILSAGTETTSSTAVHGLHAFTQFPDQRELLMSDYEQYATTAVDEVVRWATVIPAFRRTALNDTVVGDQAISAGDVVAMFFVSSNFDETVFTNPTQFDITRSPNPLQSFGGKGIHQCLGNPLARLELRVLYQELFTTLPDIVTVGEPTTLESPVAAMFRYAPVEFTPR